MVKLKQWIAVYTQYTDDRAGAETAR